ncbi:MAG TPA: hypothetical protein VGM39_23075 [Kofleriaceae bacterium]|jgi:hypothetical protein
MHLLRSFGLAAIAAVMFAACASTPKPEAAMASSEGAIRGASEAGADTVPQAQLHLKLAEEQRATALAMIKDGHNGRAKYVLARSEADAELAIALARQAAAEKDAADANAKVETLEDKVNQ